MIIITTILNAIKNHLCQPPASLNKLNAAPWLKAKVKFKKPVTAFGLYGKRLFKA